MRKMLQRAGVVLAALTLMFLVWTGTHQAGDQPDSSDNKALSESLRKVINAGADLFNKYSDVNGCYNMYYGALIAVRPALKEDLQKVVDDGLAKAMSQGSLRRRAFTLNKTLQDVRKGLAGKAEPLPLPTPEKDKSKDKDKPVKDKDKTKKDKPKKTKNNEKPKKDKDEVKKDKDKVKSKKDAPKKDGEKTAPPSKDKKESEKKDAKPKSAKDGTVCRRSQINVAIVRNAGIVRRKLL